MDGGESRSHSHLDRTAGLLPIRRRHEGELQDQAVFVIKLLNEGFRV